MSTTPLIINGDTGAFTYPAILHAILYQAPVTNSAPRGLAIHDAGLTIINLKTSRHALPSFASRKLNPKIAFTEAVQLVGGFADENLVRWASQSLARLTIGETGSGLQHGNYGRRIGLQSFFAFKKLREDFETRQANITLWDPTLDNAEGLIDYPCTSSITFRGRHEHGRRVLDMTVFMRSNDAWLGLPYDMFQFSMLHQTLANLLNADYGRYVHIANSMHIYQKDLLAVRDFMNADDHDVLTIETPTGFGRGLHRLSNNALMDAAYMWGNVHRYVKALVYTETEFFTPLTPAEYGVSSLFASFREKEKIRAAGQPTA